MINKRNMSSKWEFDIEKFTSVFARVDLATVDAKYMVGYDTYDDDQYCYILARKVGDVTEILLEKKYRINNKADKDQFEADVKKLAEYFNCEVRWA